MVTQTVHLKTRRSRGQRTRALQVMQLPVAKSRLPLLMSPLLWPLGWEAGLFTGTVISSSDESDRSGWSRRWRCCCCCCFFLLENRDGNGWLMDREWVGRRGLEGWKSDSEELESALLSCSCAWSGTAKSGRPTSWRGGTVMDVLCSRATRSLGWFGGDGGGRGGSGRSRHEFDVVAGRGRRAVCGTGGGGGRGGAMVLPACLPVQVDILLRSFRPAGYLVLVGQERLRHEEGAFPRAMQQVGIGDEMVFGDGRQSRGFPLCRHCATSGTVQVRYKSGTFSGWSRRRRQGSRLLRYH